MYKKRLTTKEFIQKAKLIHGNKYDYSKVDYINNYTKVCIICSEHGEFWQKPTMHIFRQNKCPKCSNNCKLTIENFIQKAKLIHGNKYDYSKIEYISNNTTKINIICPIHKIFTQKILVHLRGHGCPKCKKLYSPTTNEFIQNAKLIHNNKYDYSKVNYINNKTKVCIICPEHGEFWQKPNNHLTDQGCFKCKNSKGEKIIHEWLKDNNILFETQKIFKNCKHLRSLPFDFYISSLNTCIEYDGLQHFKSIKCWGGIKALQKIQLHDNIKNQYCKINNIYLIRIHYTNIKNIKNLLNNIFFKNIN